MEDIFLFCSQAITGGSEVFIGGDLDLILHEGGRSEALYEL